MSTRLVIEGDPTRLRADAPPGLFLARDGAWYFDRQEIAHERLAALLHRSIARDDAGALLVTTGLDRMAFVCELAPYLVRTTDDGLLVLSDGTREPLSADAALHVDGDGHALLRVKGGRFWALLARPLARTVLDTLDDDQRVTLLGVRLAVVEETRPHWRD